MTIMLPEDLGRRLEEQAKVRRMSVVQFVEKLLDELLQEAEARRQAEQDLLNLVLQIQAAPPPHPSTFQAATTSLNDLLAIRMRTETPIDSEEWDRQWAQFELDEKILSRREYLQPFSN